MKPLSFALPLIAPVILAAALTGCATDQSRQHKQHHPDNSAAPAKMGDKSSGGMAMTEADMMAMCGDMHEKMMSAKTPEERKAMMQEHMKSMPPDMMKKHMAMMQEHMKMMQEHMGAQMPGK